MVSDGQELFSGSKLANKNGQPMKLSLVGYALKGLIIHAE